MNLDKIIADIDAEIARLTAARNALTGSRKRGPRKSRVWTAAQRARHARTMKARWAKRNKAKR